MSLPVFLPVMSLWIPCCICISHTCTDPYRQTGQHGTPILEMEKPRQKEGHVLPPPPVAGGGWEPGLPRLFLCFLMHLKTGLPIPLRNRSQASQSQAAACLPV